MANKTLTRQLLIAATSISTGNVNVLEYAPSTYQATVVGTGAVTATVTVEVSNDKLQWLTLATITLSGTDAASDGFPQERVPWAYVRGRLAAVTGTGARVTLTQGWCNVSLG